jgi:DNA-binding transcriptional LysR family regulator
MGLGNLVPASALRFSHYDQLIQAAVDGQGVALGRHPLVDRLLSQGRLVAPFAETPTDSGAYYVMTHPAPLANPDSELFTDWLLEAAASSDGA